MITMDFITRYLKNVCHLSNHRLSLFYYSVSFCRKRFFQAALLSLCLAYPFFTQAAEINVIETRLETNETHWQLNAKFRFDLPPALEEAINKGIALYFVSEFKLSRARWYWFDEEPVSISRVTRISYHPLMRQYGVSTGGLQLRFNTLDEALNMVKSIRGWHVIEQSTLEPNQTYTAALRLYLDTSQMPKPFQIHAVNARDWNLASEWRRFSFGIPDSKK